MSPEEKIADVLKKIQDERGISSNPNLVEFNFNDEIIGPGIVAGEDERKVLLKLNSEKIINLKVPEDKDAIYKYNYVLEEHIFTLSWILVEITGNFESYYKNHKRYIRINSIKNNWNYVNPFWLLWKLWLLIWKFSKIVWKHKIISLIITIAVSLIGVLTADYSKIKYNIDKLRSYIVVK